MKKQIKEMIFNMESTLPRYCVPVYYCPFTRVLYETINKELQK